MPSFGTVEGLQPVAAAPPNLRDEMCGRHRKRPAPGGRRSEAAQALNANVDPSSAYAGTLQSLRGGVATGPLLGPLQASVPIPVWTGLRRARPAGDAGRRRTRQEEARHGGGADGARGEADAAPAAATAEQSPNAKPATANASPPAASA